MKTTQHTDPMPIIADGGFLKNAIFMDPFHVRHYSNYEVLYSEWEESIRKNIERTIGILKNRFRILKSPILFRHKLTVIFHTCCAIHIMLLTYDDAHNGESLERCQQFWQDMLHEEEVPIIDAIAINVELLNVRREEGRMKEIVKPYDMADILNGHIFKLEDYEAMLTIF